MRVALNVVFIAAIVAALAGGAFFFARDSGSGGVQVILTTPSPTETNEVKVYITGAVNAPGVYTLSDGARVEDAIAIAGGATSEANLEAVNLALRVRDEDKVTIPRRGETVADVSSSSVVADAGSAIDINTADVDMLTSLPGIGEVKAQAIVTYRERNGPFTRIEDLLEISGIGTATLEAIRNRVVAR